MKKRYFLMWLLIGAVVAVWFSACNIKQQPEAVKSEPVKTVKKRQPSKPADKETQERVKTITKLTAKIFSQQHYRQQPLNSQISSQIFDSYFKTLDPGKMYFTAGDMNKFEPRRNLLAGDLQNGDTDFAFAVYDVFKERFDQFHAFAEEVLKKPIDFTVDEEFVIDRSKLQYAQDENELKKLWLQKIKSDLLYNRLAGRLLKEAGKKGSSEKQKIHVLWEMKKPEDKLLTRLKDLQNYYDQRDAVDILSMYLNSVTAVYGPHSGYLPPKIDEDFEINMSLSLIGIGATLTSTDGYIRVVSVVPGGPAALDGRLQPEDRIIAVTQEGKEPVDVVDMSVDNAVKLIRGKAGTKVTLSVLPGKKGRNAVPESITLTRAKVILKDSEAQGEVITLPRNGKDIKVGIITLPSFYMDFAAAFRNDPNFKSCTRDVKNIIEKFKKQGVETIVMDLRGNGGGSLPEAITLTGLFIKTGPVVQVRMANRRTDVESDDDDYIAWTGPLVVLTNKMSASAAEIFTGAIKDYKRGVVVGDTRTFGKGTVLSMLQLERMLGLINRKFPAGSIRLESAMFFRINGSSVQQQGVEPDIILPSLTEQLEIGEMFSDNHLPWDSIRAGDYSLSDKDLAKKIPLLAEASAKRIAADPEYKKLQKRIERLQKQLKKKSISLNEEKRWKEYVSEKEAMDMEEELAEPAPKNDKKGIGNDPVLKEAGEIAADLFITEAAGGKK